MKFINGNNMEPKRKEPPRLYLVMGLTALLTGLCAPPEREYSRQVIEHVGDVEIAIDEIGHYPWSNLEFGIPVNRVALIDENGRELVIALCNDTIDCVSGVDVQSCEVCYTDEPTKTCWQSDQDSGQGTIDCTGKREIIDDNDYDYRGEFTLTLETANGEVTTMTYLQDYMDPEPSCGY